jgi:PBP1b-binding outer membrane lipoprotein LpoB
MVGARTMKKLIILFISIGLLFVGCSTAEDTGNTSLDKKMDTLVLNDSTEIDLFAKAVNDSIKEPGIVNMIDPQYKFDLDGDTFYLWITAESGTIMNTKDTHTIYSLSKNSVKEIYEFVKKE